VVEEKLVTKGFSEIRAEWNGQAARLGKNITVRINQAEIRGIFDGIDEDGSLLLLTPSGKIVIPAADIYF
jgi:BirA family biotin operon repressor/biotin-[acetyl-CoA-carboxylase] ligase